MKAVWYEKTGPAATVLELGERPVPEPQAGEVRVRVLVSGVNPSDVKSRAGVRAPMAFPCVIPHSDGAGIIEAVGTGVTKDRIGERVWTWNAAWDRPYGTCAEFVCVPESQAVRLPDSVGFDAGACLGIPGMTASHAVFADGAVDGKTLLVTGGAGSVGNYATQLAKWGGARVITTVSGFVKAQHSRAAGADHVINYRDEDVASAVKAFTSGAGVDRIVEVELGGNLETSVKILKPGGAIAAYGSMAIPKPEFPVYPLMFKHITMRLILVYRLSGGERRRACELLTKAMEENALTHTIAARFPLEATAQAHRAVESGELIGNAVIDVSAGS
ncbi:NADPH:quinone reductase [Bradyrhizobium sp. AZCC 1693]|uniref:NADPH:quinone reductase n=1 Tax=Bradyrhizobium sp. AZCC 1693 TaxID=3117029 RepID=UPI002FF19DF4